MENVVITPSSVRFKPEPIKISKTSSSIPIPTPHFRPPEPNMESKNLSVLYPDSIEYDGSLILSGAVFRKEDEELQQPPSEDLLEYSCSPPKVPPRSPIYNPKLESEPSPLPLRDPSPCLQPTRSASPPNLIPTELHAEQELSVEPLEDFTDGKEASKPMANLSLFYDTQPSSAQLATNKSSHIHNGSPRDTDKKKQIKLSPKLPPRELTQKPIPRSEPPDLTPHSPVCANGTNVAAQPPNCPTTSTQQHLPNSNVSLTSSPDLFRKTASTCTSQMPCMPKHTSPTEHVESEMPPSIAQKEPNQPQMRDTVMLNANGTLEGKTISKDTTTFTRISESHDLIAVSASEAPRPALLVDSLDVPPEDRHSASTPLNEVKSISSASTASNEVKSVSSASGAVLDTVIKQSDFLVPLGVKQKHDTLSELKSAACHDKELGACSMFKHQQSSPTEGSDPMLQMDSSGRGSEIPNLNDTVHKEISPSHIGPVRGVDPTVRSLQREQKFIKVRGAEFLSHKPISEQDIDRMRASWHNQPRNSRATVGHELTTAMNEESRKQPLGDFFNKNPNVPDQIVGVIKIHIAAISTGDNSSTSSHQLGFADVFGLAEMPVSSSAPTEGAYCVFTIDGGNARIETSVIPLLPRRPVSWEEKEELHFYATPHKKVFIMCCKTKLTPEMETTTINLISDISQKKIPREEYCFGAVILPVSSLQQHQLTIAQGTPTVNIVECLNDAKYEGQSLGLQPRGSILVKSSFLGE